MQRSNYTIQDSPDVQIYHAIVENATQPGQAHVLDDGRINIRLGTTAKRSRFSAPFVGYVKQPDRHHAIKESDQGGRTPPLHIVIQVVGSRGDVQPFIALGLALKRTGHRVRIATHSSFKDFVEDYGLEFFNIGGDPKRLMAYMVKNPGLLPSFHSIRHGDISENRADIREILEGCWRSCFQFEGQTHDSRDADWARGTPFLANAIIANPPSFAHVHCAERLGIPLHLMFTMPWSPTQAFPHPLSNIQSTSLEPTMTNYLSYILVDMLTWEGLGDVINSFRRNSLGLKPLSRSSGPTITSQLRIPCTYCWSPTLIPKPDDWDSYISVAGFYFLPVVSTYIPPPSLEAFLKEEQEPIYVGFGSIVVDNSISLTQLIIEAIRLAGVRAIISQGWCDLGLGTFKVPSNIHIIGNCPHDWIFKQVSCVVHHGGAGTTAAAMRAGKPSVIVPFFGDQSFWGQTVAQAGAGPAPIPFKKLTASKLSAAIQSALNPAALQRAKSLAEDMSREDGVNAGITAFHQQLLKSCLSCSISPTRTAAWRVRKTDIRLSSCAAAILMEEKVLDFEKIELLKPCSYDLNIGPRDPFSGIAFAVIDSAADVIGGFDEFRSSVVKLFKTESARSDRRRTIMVTGLRGIRQTSVVLIRMPVQIGVAITQGLHNSPRIWGDLNVRPQPAVDSLPSGLKSGYEELIFGVYDSISGLLRHEMPNDHRPTFREALRRISIGGLTSVSKSLSGLTAVITYPLQGLDAELAKRLIMKDLPAYEKSVILQGSADAAYLSEDERCSIISQWQTVTCNVKKTRLKKRRVWGSISLQ